jgi:hypothetical protein
MGHSGAFQLGFGGRHHVVVEAVREVATRAK